jgi:hypothetical protein
MPRGGQVGALAGTVAPQSVPGSQTARAGVASCSEGQKPYQPYHDASQQVHANALPSVSASGNPALGLGPGPTLGAGVGGGGGRGGAAARLLMEKLSSSDAAGRDAFGRGGARGGARGQGRGRGRHNAASSDDDGVAGLSLQEYEAQQRARLAAILGGGGGGGTSGDIAAASGGGSRLQQERDDEALARALQAQFDFEERAAQAMSAAQTLGGMHVARGQPARGAGDGGGRGGWGRGRVPPAGPTPTGRGHRPAAVGGSALGAGAAVAVADAATVTAAAIPHELLPRSHPPSHASASGPSAPAAARAPDQRPAISCAYRPEDQPSKDRPLAAERQEQYAAASQHLGQQRRRPPLLMQSSGQHQDAAGGMAKPQPGMPRTQCQQSIPAPQQRQLQLGHVPQHTGPGRASAPLHSSAQLPEQLSRGFLCVPPQPPAQDAQGAAAVTCCSNSKAATDDAMAGGAQQEQEAMAMGAAHRAAAAHVGLAPGAVRVASRAVVAALGGLAMSRSRGKDRTEPASAFAAGTAPLSPMEAAAGSAEQGQGRAIGDTEPSTRRRAVQHHTHNG